MIAHILILVVTATISISLSNPPGKPDRVIVGKASTFHPRDNHNNGKLACGGKWKDSTLPICAMRSPQYKCGTWLLVENTRNKKRSWCVLSDRGPYGMLDEEGNWFNGAEEYKAAKLEGRAMKPGKFRGVIDLGPTVADAIGSNGFITVKVRWWRHNPFHRYLTSLYFQKV